MFFTYILQSTKDGRYYVGSSDNIQRRVEEHNKGLSTYTRLYKPWKLIYKEEYNSLSEARKRERQIKAWKKRAAIERLIYGPIV